MIEHHTIKFAPAARLQGEMRFLLLSYAWATLTAFP